MGDSVVVLVDFENVQEIDFDRLGPGVRLTVFAGDSQKKVPIEVAMGLQAMGERARWVKASGAGPNALDFHIAFELGRMVQAGECGPIAVLSNDKGFDPLLAWLSAEAGIRTTRAATIDEALAGLARRDVAPIIVDDRTAQTAHDAANGAARHRMSAAMPLPTTPPPPLPQSSASAANPVPATQSKAISANSVEADAEKAKEILGRSSKVARPRRRTTLATHIKSMLRPRELRDAEVEAIIARLVSKRWISDNKGAISYNF